MDAKKNQPVFGEGFWLICIAVGVLLLGIVCFFSRREDLHSCERRMSVTVEFIKEQVGSYSKYNKIAMAKALVRETTAVPRLAGISMDCDEETLHRLAEDVWVTGISVLDAQCELLCEYTTDGVGYEELRAGIAPERLANVPQFITCVRAMSATANISISAKTKSPPAKTATFRRLYPL